MTVLIAASMSCMGAPVLYAQDVSRQDIAMQNQILELRQDVDALRSQLAAGQGGGAQTAAPAPPSAGGASADILPQLLDRVSQLEEQARTLQGQMDEVRNGMERQNTDLGKQIADLAFRVQTLEGGPAKPADAGAPAVPPLSSGPGAQPPALVRPPAGAAVGMQGGYAALARRDYPAAEAAARQTLANPRAPRAYDAQFLLAQALAGQHKYQEAALAYDDSYGKSRRGVHAPDALLGLAGALAALGEKPAACATLDKLRAEFPGGRPDTRAASAAIGRRASCR